MAILIGSRALNAYVPVNRIMHDWDFYMNHVELANFNKKYKQFLVKETTWSCVYDINGEIVEIRNPGTLAETDLHFFKYQDTFITEVKTPFEFDAKVPPLRILHDVKKATLDHIKEPKHEWDLGLIKKQFNHTLPDTQFYRTRSKEIGERVKNSSAKKFEFFHKYHIPEYILHDRLHDMYTDLLQLPMATYKRITTAETDIAEELFNKLTHVQKISLMVEESLVLALERWFIPRMIEDGINYKLVDMFDNNNEAMPTYLILKHCCITGLKGEAEYITGFARANFFEIEKEWRVAKAKIKADRGFPVWFYDELFVLRAKYKKGEKVALV